MVSTLLISIVEIEATDGKVVFSKYCERCHGKFEEFRKIYHGTPAETIQTTNKEHRVKEYIKFLLSNEEIQAIANELKLKSK